MSSRLALPLFVLVMALAVRVRADPPTLPAGFTDCWHETLTERVLVCQGRAYLRAGRPDIALRKALLSLSQHPTRDAHNLAGDALRQQKRCREARAHYTAVLQVASDDAIAGAGLTACAQGPPPRVSAVLGALLGSALLEGSAWAGEHQQTSTDPAAPWPAWKVIVGAVVLVAFLGLVLVCIGRRDRRAQRSADRLLLLLGWVLCTAAASGCAAIAENIDLCGALTCPGAALPKPRPGDPVATMVRPGVWDVSLPYDGAQAHLASALAAQQGPLLAQQYGCRAWTVALHGAEQHAEKPPQGLIHVQQEGDKKPEPPPTITLLTLRLTCDAPVPVAGILLPAHEPRPPVDDPQDESGGGGS